MSRTDKDAPYFVREQREGVQHWHHRLGYYTELPHYAPSPQDYADQQYLHQERKRQRRRDKQLLRTVRDWDDYSHPRHPFNVYALPSW